MEKNQGIGLFDSPLKSRDLAYQPSDINKVIREYLEIKIEESYRSKIINLLKNTREFLTNTTPGFSGINADQKRSYDTLKNLNENIEKFISEKKLLPEEERALIYCCNTIQYRLDQLNDTSLYQLYIEHPALLKDTLETSLKMKSENTNYSP